MNYRPFTSGLLAAALSCTTAVGEVIFSNLGPGDSFNTEFAWPIRGEDVSPGNLVLATRFTVGATDYFLDTAELALRYLSGNNALSVELWSDSSGLPGACWERFPSETSPPSRPS